MEQWWGEVDRMYLDSIVISVFEILGGCVGAVLVGFIVEQFVFFYKEIYEWRLMVSSMEVFYYCFGFLQLEAEVYRLVFLLFFRVGGQFFQDRVFGKRSQFLEFCMFLSVGFRFFIGVVGCGFLFLEVGVERILGWSFGGEGVGIC